ncbi:MAG: choice-of-anchor G family protein, partial [Corynebacterium sp.]|uniref:choice-of-anchor G family protein n=1 Tax=Corynebacterium sp. TaxID=1720 RepID=UPI0017C32595
MQSQPLGVSANLAKRRKWLRLGVATLTSTALVGGSLVPVPAHPLIKNPLVAEAAAQELAESHAEGLAIELSLLRGFVAPEDLGTFDEALTAIHAEQSWPEDEGQPAQTSQLNLSLLQSVDLNLGSLSVPLIDDGSNNGLLQVNTDGVGVLSAFASAPNASTATASAGVINEDGSINADPSQGSGNVETNLQLTALLDQLGVDPLTNGIAD